MTPADWHTYSDLGELLADLELTDDDIARAGKATDEHIRNADRRELLRRKAEMEAGALVCHELIELDDED